MTGVRGVVGMRLEAAEISGRNKFTTSVDNVFW